ncbi:MAG: hypothetical protein ACMUIU_01515 [bacterium]
MNDFNSVISRQNQLDPLKRVNYTKGLVLGVDEFEQEQFYLMERDHLQNRALHGYGTIWGLDVSVCGSPEDPEVMVSPGLALDTSGRMINVTTAQCAHLNAWLTKNKDSVMNYIGSPPGSLTIHVVLRYKECETDTVPIPGEPCRSQEDIMAPSRISDYFDLSLQLEPPLQSEEDILRCFGRLLSRIEITTVPGDFITQQEMEDLVRDLIEYQGSPPDYSPPETGSPPGYTTLRVHPDEAYDILSAAFRVWITEVRPTLLTKNRQYDSDPSDESCVLLAQISFTVIETDNPLKVEGDININQNLRPLLIQTRLLQEWLLTGKFGQTANFPYSSDNEPLNGQILIWESMSPGQWKPKNLIFLPLVTINEMDTKKFEVWFNIGLSENIIEIKVFDTLKVMEELIDGSLKEIRIKSISRRQQWNNIFDLELNRVPSSQFLRFMFDISGIELTDNRSSNTIAEYAGREAIRFLGQDSQNIVTAFVRRKG